MSAVRGALPAALPLRWVSIFRLGLVQAALGSIVVLVTSTLNRVMVVEYSLPAVLPGMLVALHYLVQIIRPRFGYGSDRGLRRTPWIIGGMAVLAAGGCLCALATVWLPVDPAPAFALAVAAYALVGLGVGAAGTSLLVLLARRVDDERRAAAATIMWVLMIAGFAITSSLVGHFLDPFSPQRLIVVTSVAALAAFALACAALFKVEEPNGRGGAAPKTQATCAAGAIDGAGAAARKALPFSAALRRVWSEPQARRFTIFVFISMLAYSAQELLLEPFAGLVFGYSLGDSAKLSGLWHASALIGMIGIGFACSGRRRAGSLRGWTVVGCAASAAAISSLLCAALVGPAWPVKISVIALGVANGVFAVAAIGSMMQLAQQGEAGTAGVRMGLWGAAQAVAFALGGILATGIVDAGRWLIGSANGAYVVVFALEAALFLIAAWFAAHTRAAAPRTAAGTTRAITS